MAKQSKKKKNVQINPVGEAHIQASFNNIIGLGHSIGYLLTMAPLFIISFWGLSRSFDSKPGNQQFGIKTNSNPR